MSTENWSCPDADGHGFVSFELIQEKAAASNLEQFLENFPMPALLSVFSGLDPALNNEVLDSSQSGVQLLTVSIKSTAILRYLGKLAFVTKRPGNPYAHLISVGRSTSNDITVAVDSVSKVHGYFARDPRGWSFTDHGSTNGSSLGERQLDQGEKYPLFDGSLLRLGLDVTFEYLSPESLFQRAHQAKNPT